VNRKYEDLGEVTLGLIGECCFDVVIYVDDFGMQYEWLS